MQSLRSQLRHRRALKRALLERTAIGFLCSGNEPAIRILPNAPCQLRPSSSHLMTPSTITSTPRLPSSGYHRDQGSCQRHWAVRELHTSTLRLSSSRGRLTNQKDAEHFIANLLPAEREVLEKALEEQKMPGDPEKPSWRQLRLLCYQHALPFIGFGFLDNAIMITVGEYIDLTIGVTLGISTMAAAGLGNMISDLAGIGLADQVEAVCRRLGLPNPRLSPEQMKHSSTRWMALLGRCVGIAIGCMIGMAPLLWFQNPHRNTASGDGEATDK